jgi:hypothetical protein
MDDGYKLGKAMTLLGDIQKCESLGYRRVSKSILSSCYKSRNSIRDKDIYNYLWDLERRVLNK